MNSVFKGTFGGVFALAVVAAGPALACRWPQGYVPPTPQDLFAAADSVVFGPVTIQDGKLYITPEQTLKAPRVAGTEVKVDGGTCSNVQVNWLKTGDYCLLYLDAENVADLKSDCTMGDQNGERKAKLLETFQDLQKISNDNQSKVAK